MAEYKADAQSFLNHLPNGGYRPNRYKIILTTNFDNFDNGIQTEASQAISFLAKSSSVPTSTMGMAEAHYMGRSIKMAGDMTFEDWTVDVYANIDVRNFFEMWHDHILGYETNVAMQNYRMPRQYYADANIELLDRENNVIAKYIMKQIFPTSVGSIELGADSNDTVATFSVTFAVNYFKRENMKSPWSKHEAKFQELSVGASITQNIRPR